ncbi:MAG: ABC transporter substrate-binding protein [Rhodobacter sp.]|uniref:ABC transporter substrate-binding protein n=1 Tax=Pararhodobacter sp. TaxID=2127056 RepID=UPI001D71478D|nr:ABC transporter substrate-binding protein [Pararhodobacter sp.]MCB1345304.1 ABC transporter substrate-binding protein [Paracoccaceae bacterium]MCC0073990.1 ABC transporter substrate-binding protein [Rhodobacter sp.]HPD93523.1 ABC transporter substrate-binding protein [Pararhodobacter sp.]
MNDEIRYMLDRAARGKMPRRAFLGRAAALGVASTAATGLLTRAVHAQGPRQGGSLVVGMQGGESTNSLDPALAASQVPFLYGYCAGETLVNIAPDGSLLPKLAEEWDASANAQTWRFKIRRGVQFHNGQTLTPEDVAQTLRRHSDENSQSGALGIMRGISSIAVDGDHVVLETATPNADLPYLLADYHLLIQPNGGFDDPTSGIMTGPYKWAENEPGVRHVLEKFDGHWDSGVGHFNSIEILVINDATARNSALQSGQVQLINRVEPRVAGLLSRAPGVSVESAGGRGHYVFIMRCDAAPFDNNDLRMALKLAVNRQDMVDRILRGYGSIGNDMPINAAYPLFDDTIPQREYDPDQARFYYERSGHSGPIDLRTSEVAFPGAIDAAQLFKESAAAAGIDLNIIREPGDGYWSEVWNVQPFSASYWGGRPVQDQMYSTAYLSTADWNDTAFRNAHFDEMLIQARGELDLTRRKELYSEMGRLVRDEGGLIAPMFNDFIDAHNDQVAGWVSNPAAEMMGGQAAIMMWSAT